MIFNTWNGYGCRPERLGFCQKRADFIQTDPDTTKGANHYLPPFLEGCVKLRRLLSNKKAPDCAGAS